MKCLVCDDSIDKSLEHYEVTKVDNDTGKNVTFHLHPICWKESVDER